MTKYPKTEARVMKSAAHEEIQSKINKLNAELKALYEKQKQEQANTFISCYHCRKINPIGKFVYVQHFDWDFDHWVPGDGGAICPDCDKECRDMYYQPDFCEYDLRKYFKSVKEKYKD